MSGGILADSEIRRAIACGDIEIDPYEPAHVNPVSIDLTLGDQVLIYLDWVGVYNDATYLMACDPVGPGFDVRNVPRTQSLRIGESGFLLKPGIGYLMHTRERIHTKKYVSIIDGKSSLGRLFLQVHFTAGYGDVGFNGQYTLEVSVLHPLRIYAGMKIAQMRFHTVVGEVEKLYEGNYTGNDAHGPVASKAYKQFKGAP
jgi:dCTP deaminase